MAAPIEEKMAEKANEPVNKKQKTDEDIEEDGVEDCTKAADADLQAEKSPILGEDGKPLSKRALKRLAKRENFQKWKTEKRAKEREKKKQKMRAALESGESRAKPSKKEMKKNSMAKSQCKVKVVVDSSFDDYMSERETNSHVLQMQHAYAANRRAANPLQFYVTSVSGPTEERLVSVGDYKGWDVNFHFEHYLDLFKKESIVYLSSDSANVMQTVEEDKVYIIGGLVDHNKHKGLCHKKAEEAGVAHARLPIEEYIKLQTRKVLACNHVFEILLRYTELKDWEKAFFSVIPKRKGATGKDNGDEKDNGISSQTGQEQSQDSNDQLTQEIKSENEGAAHSEVEENDVISDSVKDTDDQTLEQENESECLENCDEIEGNSSKLSKDEKKILEENACEEK